MSESLFYIVKNHRIWLFAILRPWWTIFLLFTYVFSPFLGSCWVFFFLEISIRSKSRFAYIYKDHNCCFLNNALSFWCQSLRCVLMVPRIYLVPSFKCYCDWTMKVMLLFNIQKILLLVKLFWQKQLTSFIKRFKSLLLKDVNLFHLKRLTYIDKNVGYNRLTSFA